MLSAGVLSQKLQAPTEIKLVRLTGRALSKALQIQSCSAAPSLQLKMAIQLYHKEHNGEF